MWNEKLEESMKQELKDWKNYIIKEDNDKSNSINHQQAIKL